MKKIKDLTFSPIGSIREQIINDTNNYDNEEDKVSYIRDVAEYGCVGGTCNNLIYYVDTYDFYNKHAEEIDEILEEIKDSTGVSPLENYNKTDLRNYLAWLAYEYRAQEIMQELELNN